MSTQGGAIEAKVRVSADVEVPAARLWEVLGDFTDLRWVPPFHGVEFDGDGPGMVRRIRLAAGMDPIVERLESVDAESRTIVYSVTENNPLPVEGYLATMAITETAPQRCRLDWSCTFEPAAVMTEDQAVAAVDGFYSALVTRIKAVVEG